jgi:membrane protease YdiL (CAAX protease family)
MTERISEHPAGRRWAVVGLLLGAVAIGCLCAPPVFNAVLAAGRRWPALSGWRDTLFKSVFNRCLLVSLLVFLYPVLRLGGILHPRNWGFIRHPGAGRRLGVGLLIGIGSLSAIWLIGWLPGAYGWGPEEPVSSLLWQSLLFIPGAILVGVIEEALFRGLLFGLLRRAVGLWGGAILASVVFSAVHFAAPAPKLGVVYGHWYSGFRMLGSLFPVMTYEPWTWVMMAMLFTMGMTLCLVYQRYGDLYAAIGLHAGWVWAMRTGGLFLVRNGEQGLWLFGPSTVVAKSGLALVMGLLFMVGAAWMVIRSRNEGTEECRDLQHP